MIDLKNKQLADTFNTRVRTPWVWLVLAITVGLSVLFYFSQKPQVLMYSRYMKTLSDYQLQEAFTMRAMDRIRLGLAGDTVYMQAQTMNLREMAMSFTREMDEVRGLGVLVPSQEMVSKFEREVLGKVAGMRRYMASRIEWQKQYDSVYSQVQGLDLNIRMAVMQTLDSMRVGYLVSLDPVMASQLPVSMVSDIGNLARSNENLALAWNGFDNSMATMYCDDMISFFQSERTDEISLKAKIPMAFYFLSLVLLLSTFFFIFRSKNTD